MKRTWLMTAGALLSSLTIETITANRIDGRYHESSLPSTDDAHPYRTPDGQVHLPDDSLFQHRRTSSSSTSSNSGSNTTSLRSRTQQPSRLLASRRYPTAGPFHNLVLLLRFSDHATRPLPPRDHYDLLYNSPSTEDIVVPTGSVRTYFRTNSYGAFDVKSTVVGWITLSKPEGYYANGDYGFVRIREAIEEGLDHVQNDLGYDFNEFDANDDGVVDGFGILVSGYGAEFAGADCEGADNVNRVWSHKGTVDWKSENNVTVDRYYVSSGLRNKCGSDIARMGVICHELGHYLGLPDLYDNTWKGSGIGALDVMSQSWGYDGTGVYPPLLSAWSKVSVGWVVPTVIDRDGAFELENSETSDRVYKIDAGFPRGEYLLLENRQPNGYDSRIPHGGIAIWHIDENASQNTRGYPGQDEDSWPENGNHYRVALLPADGDYHLERGVNQGDAHDLWHASSSHTELKSGGDDVYPNTDSYQDGLITPTGIRIFGFSSSKNTMTFEVTGLQTKRPTETPSKSPSTSPSHGPSRHPVSDAPTNLPTGSPSHQSVPAVSDAPTDIPTSNVTSTKAPVVPSTASSQSPSTSESERCAGICFEPVPSSECPVDQVYVDCQFSYLGSICYTNDDYCGTDPNLSNCNGLAAYRRVDCIYEVETESESPTASPTSKPTLLFISANTTYSYIPADGDADSCKYYPGWSTGLNYCVSGCDLPMPDYINNNPSYEFDTLDQCCSVHYNRKERCKRASLEASYSELEEVDGLASIGGHVWNDSDGDGIRESSDHGLEAVVVDLYECEYNTWVKGSRTAPDGSFLMNRIPPGLYSMKVTAPTGFHFNFHGGYWQNADLDPSIATMPCLMLLPDKAFTSFNVGIVPDPVTIQVPIVPVLCPEILDPICGCDETTYNNECFAKVAGVEICSKGLCTITDDCHDHDIDFVCGCDGDSYPNECVAKAAGTKVCSKGACKKPIQSTMTSTTTATTTSIEQSSDLAERCPKIFAPVCGCDKDKYNNVCLAHAAGVRVCPEGVCICRDHDINFVCGCDGNTYPNECVAEAAGTEVCSESACRKPTQTSTTSTTTALSQQTSDPVACPMIFAPVCSCNNLTYSNKCLAKAAAVEICWEGACGEHFIVSEKTAPYVPSESDEDNCKYYSGWSIGLNYCVSDCDIPKSKLMDNNPEFETLDLCCGSHFKRKRRKERCKRDSLDASYTNQQMQLGSNKDEEPITIAHGKSSPEINQDKPAASKSNPVAREKVQVAPKIVEKPTSIHSKTFVRGGNAASASNANIVTIQATEVATVSQHKTHSDDQPQDLRVSKDEFTLLKFDVSFLQDKRPTSAILRLLSLSASPVGGSVHMASHNLWNGDIVTWDDAPDAGDIVNDIGSIHPNQWVEVDVTGAFTMNNDKEVSLLINMNAVSNWTAKYSSRNVQLRMYF